MCKWLRKLVLTENQITMLDFGDQICESFNSEDLMDQLEKLFVSGVSTESKQLKFYLDEFKGDKMFREIVLNKLKNSLLFQLPTLYIRSQKHKGVVYGIPVQPANSEKAAEILSTEEQSLKEKLDKMAWKDEFRGE